ncbi:MAG: hypothetical protein PVI53_13920, partial [Desulfobacteraceae bacterium]
ETLDSSFRRNDTRIYFAKNPSLAQMGYFMIIFPRRSKYLVNTDQIFFSSSAQGLKFYMNDHSFTTIRAN